MQDPINVDQNKLEKESQEEQKNLLSYSDLEPLKGSYKLAGYPSTGYSLVTILTFGLGLAIFERWDEESLENLKASLNNKIEQEYGDIYGIYLTGTGREIIIMVLADAKINLLKVDKSSDNISEIHNLRPREIMVKTGYKEYSFIDRNSRSRIIKLKFSEKSKLDEIKDYFKSLDYYFYRGIWDEKEVIEEFKRADTGLKQNFQNLSPYEFEEFIAEMFKKLGYRARKTSNSGDYGVDVIAEKNGEKLAIQVKRHKVSNKVGSPTVRDTLGSKHKIDADKTMIVTTSYFTQPAKEQARNSPIKLWDKDKLRRKVEKHYIKLD